VLNKTDRDSITREVMLLREAGGRTLVDVSPLPNPGRDPAALAEIWCELCAPAYR
jgi:predicted metal-dependent phosphotriesterase family hydrolase